MTSSLTPEDIIYIWRVVDHAVEKAGSHAKLFEKHQDFFDDSGRILHRWPEWMDAVRGYLIYNYGHNKTQAVFPKIIRAVMSEPSYAAYLRKTQASHRDIIRKSL